MSRRRRFRAASAAAEFVRTSAGLARFRSELDEIFAALDRCTVFVAGRNFGRGGAGRQLRRAGRGHARTYYVGPELPANASAFDECFQEKAGKILPTLFAIEG